MGSLIMPEHQNIKQSRGTQSSQRQIIPAKQVHASNSTAIIQRARIDPKSLTSAEVLQLQRTIGNRAVGRLLSEIRSPSTVQHVPIQRQEMPEEEETCPSCMQKQEIPEEEPLQTNRENNTGMPDNLKAGVESLSGIDMSDVRVHYNSSKPDEIGALAYTQGTDIHVAPGQEKHLPHEAWHVVQQAQGRVRPTMQLKDVAVNDEEGLEKEADEMANAALRVKMVQKNGNSRGKDLLRISSLKLNFSTPVQGFFYYNTRDQKMSDDAKIKLIPFFQHTVVFKDFLEELKSRAPKKFHNWLLQCLFLTHEQLAAINKITEDDLCTLQFGEQNQLPPSLSSSSPLPTPQPGPLQLPPEQEATPPRIEGKREVPYGVEESPLSGKKQATEVTLSIIKQKMMEINKLKIMNDALFFRGIANGLEPESKVTVSIIVGMHIPERPSERENEQMYTIKKYISFAGVTDPQSLLEEAGKRDLERCSQYTFVSYDSVSKEYRELHKNIHAEERSVIIAQNNKEYIVYGYSTTNICKYHDERQGCKEVIRGAKARLSGKKEGVGSQHLSSRKEFKMYLPSDIVDWFLFNYKLEEARKTTVIPMAKYKGRWSKIINRDNLRAALSTKFSYDEEPYTSFFNEALDQINSISQFGSKVWISRSRSRSQSKADILEWFNSNYVPLPLIPLQSTSSAIPINYVIEAKNIPSILNEEFKSSTPKPYKFIPDFIKYINSIHEEQNQKWVRIKITSIQGKLTLETLKTWFSTDYEPLSKNYGLVLSTQYILRAKYPSNKITTEVASKLDRISKFWRSKIGTSAVTQEQTQPPIQ
jgi:hypothetical protein